MEKIQVKRLLQGEIYANLQLYDFCMECIEHIFNEDAVGVKEEFIEYYESLDEGYGLSLECMLHNSEKRKEDAEIRLTNKEPK